MKSILILIFMIVSTATFSKTIEEKDLIGTWVNSKPYSWQGIINYWLVKPPENRLEISNNKIKFTMNNMTIEIDYENMKKIDDLYIINLQGESGYKYKIVLNGWNIGHSKILFGHFYLYNKEGLFNGWSISLTTENNSN